MSLTLNDEKERVLRSLIYSQILQAVMNSVLLQDPRDRERGEGQTVTATNKIMEKIKELLKGEEPENLTVVLDSLDIAKVTEVMHKEWGKDTPSQGYLEWSLCNAIRTVKELDFFAEQTRLTEKEEKERLERTGEK